jgi:hypothetical protein
MTIAQQLGIKEFPFDIKDSKDRLIYCEHSDEYWVKYEYNSKGNLILCKNSKQFWAKEELDADGYRIYYENSNGEIIDNRPKTEVQKAIELLTKEGLLVDGKILKT